MLRVLWVDKAVGTVSSLARQAGVPFAAAHKEIDGMARVGLAIREVEHGAAVWRANPWHPAAGVFEALLRVGDVTRESAFGAPAEEASVRAELARAEGASEAALVRGLELARRDPRMARAVATALWRSRERLEWKRLVELAGEHRVKHELGLFLDLVGAATRSGGMRARARWLRDKRVRRERDFFLVPVAGEVPPLELARRWGYRLPLALPEETFA